MDVKTLFNFELTVNEPISLDEVYDLANSQNNNGNYVEYVTADRVDDDGSVATVAHVDQIIEEYDNGVKITYIGDDYSLASGMVYFNILASNDGEKVHVEITPVDICNFAVL